MEEVKCKQVAQLVGSKYTEMTGRVYSVDGASPGIRTFSGGGTEVKIMEDCRFFRQAYKTVQANEVEEGDTIDAYNQKTNNSGISPTVTTRPEGFKTAILVVDKPTDPIIYDDYNGRIKADQSAVGTLTTNCGNDAPRNGVKIIKDCKVRKLTPRECGRLMGVKDDDITAMSKNQSDSSLYHLFGDSIVVDVLMAIFKEMMWL